MLIPISLIRRVLLADFRRRNPSPKWRPSPASSNPLIPQFQSLSTDLSQSPPPPPWFQKLNLDLIYQIQKVLETFSGCFSVFPASEKVLTLVVFLLFSVFLILPPVILFVKSYLHVVLFLVRYNLFYYYYCYCYQSIIKLLLCLYYE